MTHFYVRACPEGHYEIDYRRARQGHRCRVCEQQLLDHCPDCGRIIREWNYYGASMIPPKAEDYVLPGECPVCGKKFPWFGREGKRVPNHQRR